MPVTNIAWLWPVRFSATTYVVRVTINGVTTDLNFPSSGTIDTTLDYWVSGDGKSGTESDGTGRADLVAMLQATLRTHSQGASATVRLSMTTWKITAANGTSITILWSHANTTLDPRIFGWKSATDSAAGTSITAPNYPQGIWRPTRAVADDSRDRQAIVGGITHSLSGKRRVSRLTLPNKWRDFDLRFIPKTKALTEYAATDDPYGAFEYAWVNAIALGRVFRHYDDEAKINGATYNLYSARDLEDPLARNNRFRVWWDAMIKATLELEVEFATLYSLQFDANTDYVTFGNLQVLDGATQASWSYWIRPDTLVANDNHYNRRAGTADQFAFQTDDAAGRILFTLWNSVGTSYQWRSAAGALTAGAWHHIVGTYHATNGCAIYVNGQNIWDAGTIVTGSNPASLRSPSGTTTEMRLGVTTAGLPGFIGYIDEVGLFNVALTAADVAAAYNAGTPNSLLSLPTAPVRYWRLENNYDDTMGLTNGSAGGTPVFSSTELPP